MVKNVIKSLTKKRLYVGLKGYGEKKLFNLRKKVNGLYFMEQLSMRKIARQTGMSRNFVSKWVKSPKQDFTQDDRGWKRGWRRKWDKSIEERIGQVHQRLVDDPSRFFTGATAVEQEWRRQYPGQSPPPLRTIGRIMKELGLSGKRKKGRNKGAAKYLCYPEYTIYHRLGGRVLEADFIGRKYLRGRTAPLNFIGFSFKQTPRLRYFKRVCGETADSFIEQCDHFFKEFEKPDYVKVDNSGATIGSASGKRNISRAMRFLLERGVVPIFAVPRKPFSQASIEGNNSVFSRKVWNRIEFKSLQEADEKLEWFNIDSLRYLDYQKPKRVHRGKKSFFPRVYFIRQVKEVEEQKTKGFIDVLNEKIHFVSSYINYFVLAEWNLQKEMLSVYFEKDQKSKLIKKIPFAINKRSKQKSLKIIKNSGSLSYGI